MNMEPPEGRKSMSDIIIRKVSKTDLEPCLAVETACFEASEAADRESIGIRIAGYPEGFLVAEKDGSVIGMVNSGSIEKDDITDEAFKKLIGHVEGGKNIVIFSMAVHPDFQGLGLSRKLMGAFVATSRELGKKNVLLLCKDYHIDYYKGLGFDYGGISKSRHGGFDWHEMVMGLS